MHEATTPLSPEPPTITGLPASSGWSSTSTEAKKASMSTCRTVQASTPSVRAGMSTGSVADRVAREPTAAARAPSDMQPQSSERFGVRDPDGLTFGLRPQPHDAVRPIWIGDLALVARHRGHLLADRLGDVHPDRGFECAREVRDLRLVDRPCIAESNSARPPQETSASRTAKPVTRWSLWFR